MDKKNKLKKPLHKYLRFSAIALQMGGTIYLGSLLGKWLDEKYANQKQLYTTICTLLAVFLAIYMVVRQAIHISKEK